jgi:DNA-binding response OmpR family regulator
MKDNVLSLSAVKDSLKPVILIADGDVMTRNLLRETLRKDYEVWVAATGVEALRVAHEATGVIHILMSDADMPTAFCRQVRVARPQIKILLTSHSFLAPMEPAGSIALLPKPFEMNALRAQLRNLLAAPTLVPETQKIVLVVDDHVSRRNRTRRILTESGYAVLTAHSSRDGAKIADGASTIDLIIAAVRMDGVGIRLAEKVDASTREISTLLISHFDPALLRELPGFSKQPEFLPNPFTREALLDRVRRLLHQRPV